MPGSLPTRPRIETYRDDAHREPVIALWRDVFGHGAGHNSPVVSIDKKLAVADRLFFVALADDGVVGTTLAGYDGHRGWLYAVAVAPGFRRAGLGAALVRHAEQALSSLGCMKVNLQVVGSNAAVVGFYRALGYGVEDRVSLGRRLPENIPGA